MQIGSKVYLDGDKSKIYTVTDYYKFGRDVTLDNKITVDRDRVTHAE